MQTSRINWTKLASSHIVPAMVNTLPEQTNEEIVFHTPGKLAGALPYALQVAGLGIAHPGQEPVRKRYHDHVLLHSLAGRGRVEINDAVHVVEPSQVLWLDTSRPYAHGASGAEPWRYLWMGLRGTGLDALYGLLEVSRLPLFRPEPGTNMEAAFASVLRLAREGGPATDVLANAEVALIVARLAAGRPVQAQGPNDRRIAALTEQMRANLVHPWRIEDLAGYSGLSPSQLFRAFRAATGTTPMDFLRHERITAAKRALTDSTLSVADVAAACGYADPYHFSRDFRRLAGTTPTRFRSWFR